MANLELLLQEYNRLVGQTFERVFADVTPENLMKIYEADVDKQLEGVLAAWEQTPTGAAEGNTPAQFFQSIPTLDETLHAFKVAAKICDRGMPPVLGRHLHSFGEPAVQAMLEISGKSISVTTEEDMFEPLAAIRQLGQWRAASAIEPLLDLLYRCSKEEEIFHEEIRNALYRMGNPAVAPILRYLDQAADIGLEEEYLLSALVEIGRQYKHEEIYASLKAGFHKMEAKMLGAIFLGEYGDARAISVLRGYAEKNVRNLDQETFYEIKGAVERLGGTMDDITGQWAQYNK